MDRLSASHRGDEEIDLLTSADERVAGVVGVQHHEAGRANRVWMWEYENEEEEEEEEEAYLIFVIFLHEQNFWRITFTPKKRENYDKIHRKLPFFCVITAKYTVNCQFFALNL